ncbi:MAG: ISAs1 family transposase [Planctomycetaceae bacterium]|nr:ISAs1 family transposase [Planctomycetaceae bacterium]
MHAGPPKLDCFRDLLMNLDPDVLERALTEWITQHLRVELGEHLLQAVSLDRKTLCGTRRPHALAVHLLSAIDHASGGSWSQMQVDEKINEHKAALELLRTLTLKGCIAVSDAMVCQRDLRQQIIDSGGHYLVVLKENQPSLLRDASLEIAAPAAAFAPFVQRRRPFEREQATTIDKGHGRIERRTLTSTTVLNNYLDWPGIAQILQVQRTRMIGAKTERETVYYIISAPRGRASAQDLLNLTRLHWGAIENGLHYVRDQALGEDACSIFRGHAPQNLAACRNAGLILLRRSGVRIIFAKVRNLTQNPWPLLLSFGYPN